MGRREVRWWRYLCEGHTRAGNRPCQGTVVLCAIDETNADRVAVETYEWAKVDGAWYCAKPHAELVR